MSSLGLIRVQVIDAEVPRGGILSPNEVMDILAPQAQAQAQVAVARRRAAQVLWHVRRRRHRVLLECEMLRQEAEQQATQTVADTVAEARSHVIETAVAWLVDEAALEQKVAERVERRIREIAAEAIQSWSGSASMAEVVARNVSELLLSQRLATCSVRVHPDAAGEVSAALCGFDSCKVIADTTIRHGAAELESEFVHVSVDLATELQAIVNGIRKARETD